MAQLNELYKKIDDFSLRLSSASKEKSQCKQGCSRCCYVDLSVFHVEADNIRNWFQKLPDSKKAELKDKWGRPLSTMENFHEKVISACPFLHQEACTIYEARPLICRTQGLALKFQENSYEFMDICPLNEEMLEVLTEKEIINLDLLNSILGQIEKLDAENEVRERLNLSVLREELTKS